MPTIVRAKAEDTVCQEEEFGSFITLTTFSDEEEVVRMVNDDTVYGLGGCVWTNDLKRAHRLAKKLRTSMVWVNAYKRGNAGSPFGGVGDSGYGRELSLEAMHEYTEAKSVWVNVDAPTVDWFGED
ncbi:aldehyde dehydrogenase family protein [Paraburkholderia sp. FT54]|uniref:aldehyde dehydrogenase family protein n=1 Tax=Paraburkholderia sp. FT54 TaxID=3074437 RepID=UPI0038F61722